MAAEDGLKAQKLLAQGVWDVAYDTPSCFSFQFLLAYMQLVTPSEVAIAVRMLMAI